VDKKRDGGGHSVSSFVGEDGCYGGLGVVSMMWVVYIARLVQILMVYFCNVLLLPCNSLSNIIAIIRYTM